MSIDYQKILLKATNQTITEYSIQDGTTEISPSAFINCTQLTNINMEESLFNNIGSEAFPINCKVNNENTLLSASCSDRSFSGRIIIPNGVTSIWDSAFEGCSGLTSVTIPSSVRSIWGSAFTGCSSLTSVTIPEGLRSIGVEAFRGCTGLTSFSIPSSLTGFFGGAFSGCTGLTSITIPSSVTIVGSYAFENCTNLTNIILENRTLEEAQTLIGTENMCGYTGTITYNGGTYTTKFSEPVAPSRPS